MSPQALAQLARWGLDEADAARAGLFEASDVGALIPGMARAAAIVIPYWDPVTGAPYVYDARGSRFARVRWLNPPVDNARGFGKPRVQRYGQPARSGVRAYFVPGLPWRDSLGDPSAPVIVTEGEAKAIAAAKHGFTAIALGGVFSFAAPGVDLLPELAAIAWEGRDVYVVYDSDGAVNANVRTAEARLVETLQRQRGASVRIVRLPAAKGDKVGLDDYLLAHGAEALEKLCEASPRLSGLDAKVVALNRHVAWIERESLVYDLDQKLFLRKDAFVMGSRHSAHAHVVTTQRGAPKEISVAQTWLKHPFAQRFSEILFRPGEGVTVTGDNGQPALNMWSGFVEEAGDVQPFLNLSQHIFSQMRREDADLPVKLIAYKAQNPQIKVPLAIVMVGPQGGGKSLWGECVRAAFGPWGVAISGEQMVAQYTGWLERSLVVLANEVRADTFREEAERVRSLISELRQPMEEKFRPMREVNAYAFYIINSNRRAISSYDVDDRRMIVVDTPPPKEKAFYATVGDWLSAGGARHLMHYLLHYPLGDFTPPQRAPASDEKIMAYHEGLTPVQELAHSMLTARVPMVETWLDAAVEWARRAEVSPNMGMQALARSILSTVAETRIKPWYTPQELAMLFPSIVEQTQGTRTRMTSAGRLSRELREAGVPYLRSRDDARGFWHKGQIKQYLVVSDFDEWKAPVAQKDFDRLIDSFPVYRDVKAARRSKR